MNISACFLSLMIFVFLHLDGSLWHGLHISMIVNKNFYPIIYVNIFYRVPIIH